MQMPTASASPVYLWPGYQRACDEPMEQGGSKGDLDRPAHVPRVRNTHDRLVWLLDASAWNATQTNTLVDDLQEFLNVELRQRQRRISYIQNSDGHTTPAHKWTQIVMAWDLAPLLSLHHPLPITNPDVVMPDSIRASLHEERLLTTDELAQLPGSWSETYPGFLQWQWLRYVGQTLTCPSWALRLDLARMYSSCGTALPPATDDEFRLLIGSMSALLTRPDSMTERGMEALEKHVPHNPGVVAFRRRLAMHLLGQQLPLRMLLNKGGTSGDGRTPLHTSSSTLSTTLDTVLETVDSYTLRKETDRWPRALVKKPGKKNFLQGLLASTPPNPDAAVVVPPLTAADLIGTKVTGAPTPAGATDAFSYLLPLLLQPLLMYNKNLPPATTNGKKDEPPALRVAAPIFVSHHPETPGYVVAVLAQRLLKLNRIDAVLPTDRSYIWLEKHDPPLLDVGAFYNRVVCLCKRQLLHWDMNKKKEKEEAEEEKEDKQSPLLHAILTWVLSTLTARDRGAFEASLWSIQSHNPGEWAVFEPPAAGHPGSMMLREAIAEAWYTSAWDYVVQQRYPSQHPNLEIRPVDMLFYLTQEENDKQLGFNAIEWTQAAVTMSRVYYDALIRVPIAAGRPFDYYMFAYYAIPPRKLRPYGLDIGLTLKRVEDGLQLFDLLWQRDRARRRFFVRLDYNSSSAPLPPMCWLQGDDVLNTPPQTRVMGNKS